MAKLKLPFELEKPSSNEYVTQASQIGYGEGNVEEALDKAASAATDSTKNNVAIENLNHYIGLDNDCLIGFYINSNNVWGVYADCSCYIIPISPSDSIIMERTGSYVYALFSDFEQPIDGGAPDFCTGTSRVSATGKVEITAPQDARYLYVLKHFANNQYDVKIVINDNNFDILGQISTLNTRINNVQNNLDSTIFDISEYNKSGSPLAPTSYSDLSSALAGNNIPSALRKGGMTVRYINNLGNYEEWYYSKTGTTNADFQNVDNWYSLTDTKKKIDDVVADTMITRTTPNMYDRSQGLVSGYINSSGGISANNTCFVSKPVPVAAGHYYYLSGRNQESGFMIRCLNSSDEPLKVLIASTGEELNNWNLPKADGSGSALNGQFKVPDNAVSVQFVVTYLSSGDDTAIMLTDLGTTYDGSAQAPQYEPYGNIYYVKGVEQLRVGVYGNEVEETVAVALNAEGKYIYGSTTDGEIKSYAPLALAYYKIKKEVTYRIAVEKTTNSAGWELAYSNVADGSTNVDILQDYGKGTWAGASYEVLSTINGYLVVGYATGTSLPSVKYTGHEGGVIGDVEDLKEDVEEIKDSVSSAIRVPMMFFGDSLTAASAVGVVGFAELIANWLKMPYRKFVLDSYDGNTSDVPVSYISLTNYGKDGTCNMTESNRDGDSVIERVKRHVTADANVSIVLVECCVNDASRNNKGTISDSYTATFAQDTTLGALEETCRYLTTMEKPLKVGFYIPWKVQMPTANPSFFDDHVLVFKKWGVPYLDLRECAGFNMRDCAAQRIFSVATGNYPNYSNNSTYNTDDMVKYGGYLYKCKYDNTSGIVPTNTDYWIEVSSGGNNDGTHLNSLGHEVVWGKIRAFLESL